MKEFPPKFQASFSHGDTIRDQVRAKAGADVRHPARNTLLGNALQLGVFTACLVLLAGCEVLPKPVADTFFPPIRTDACESARIEFKQACPANAPVGSGTNACATARANYQRACGESPGTVSVEKKK
jgi:hypothetical protein